MTKRMLRGDAPTQAQVTRLRPPAGGGGEVSLTVLGSGKFLTLPAWSAAAFAAAWNASVWPEFKEAVASVSGADVLLTSTLAGRPFYVAASVGGRSFANEVQVITAVNHVTGGTATAAWLAQTTAPFDPTVTDAAGWRNLFEALAGGIVAANELTWTGTAGGPWTVTFGGRYAEQDVPLITINSSHLTGGMAAQNEIQRLSLAATSAEVSFQLRRPGTLKTTSVLTTPLTSAGLDAALTAIGYDVTVTGGPLSNGSVDASPYRTHAGTYDDNGGYAANYPSIFVRGITSRALLRFSLDVARASTITSAVLSMRAAVALPFTLRVQAEYADDAAFPANNGAALAAEATLTTALNDVALDGSGVITCDVSKIIQEIVNRAGWGSGRHIVFHLFGTAEGWLGSANGIELYGVYRPALAVSYSASGAPLDIEWVGADAATDIPQLLVIAAGGYQVAPTISTLRDGSGAQGPLLTVATSVAGGEALVIRDDVRSRGLNHYDDPLNWEGDDGTFRVPERGDVLYIETGRVDLLWGLKQRSQFVALPVLDKLRMTEIHHLWLDQAVEVMSDNTLPGGLAAATTYYVRSLDGPYVQLSATRGGAPIDITDIGNGTHTLGVRLISAEIQARWQGKLGLPRLNSAAKVYWEYRERSLEIWCPSIKLGTGIGGGSNRINLETGVVATTLQAVASGGPIEQGVNAVLWQGRHVSNQLEVLAADVGVAIFPEQVASFDQLKQRSGSVTLGRGVTGGSIDKTGGTLNSLGAVIAGQILL